MALNRVKSQLSSQLEESRRSADEELRERNTVVAQAKNYQHEAEELRALLDEESESKNDLLRQLSKVNTELQEWKNRFEGEGLSKADEIEESRRKAQRKIAELQEALDCANTKISSLEKTRSRLAGELDDAQVCPIILPKLVENHSFFLFEQFFFTFFV